MKNYLSISRAEDLKNPKEKILYRTLEIFPGFLSWGALISAIFLSWLAPVVVAIFIILFDLYWLLKISYLAFHQIVSFLQMKKNLKIDWLDKLASLHEFTTNNTNWEEIYHLIILPLYKEKKEIVEESLKSILDSKYPKDKMIIVLTLEERRDGNIKKMAEEIGERFSKKFFKFLVTIHPKDLPGEIAGKGSNIAFAVKEAKEKIIGPLKIPLENIIVSNFDIDTKPYPHYFSCLTFHYLTAKNPQKSSYQPIPIYNNNIWQAPAFSRVVATSGTFWQMMQQERPEILSTFSSHSMPFKILEEVGYPKNVVSDDSRIFWKAYLFYDGDYKVTPLYYPVSMDAVLSKNLSRTIINQYKQQRRWAWGCADIPFLFFGFFKNTKISFFEKLRHSINILDGFWSWSTSSLLIFFLGWLPLILGGEKFNITLLSYNLPRLTRNLMTLAMIGMIISGILSFKILPPKPKNRVPLRGVLRNLSMVFQWGLLPITLIFFGALPALDAQTRLMLGKHLGFWSTEKIRLQPTHRPPSLRLGP
jgi:cellulose synthase/poly-beta-1,6-N-acetylglucosamine synthase-like glycosyltransferase